MGRFEIPKVNLFQQPIQQIGAVEGQGNRRVSRTQPSYSAGNPRINNNDMKDFMANLGNINLDKPVVLNNNPDAGILRTFDVTA